jgi:DNA-binding GntR family transcriptional regulator
MNNTSLKNMITEHIYQDIINNKYQPNEHIKEVELASSLNVSRAPVRESLNELVSLGILVKHERRGIFLKDITKEEILDTYYTKGLIEGFLACDFILNANDEDFDELDRLVVKMGEKAKNSHKGCVDVGSEFHKRCLSYSTNEVLLDTLERINKKSYILFYRNWSKLYTVNDIISRHQKIANILRSKDKMMAENVIREHYYETGMKIVIKEFETR